MKKVMLVFGTRPEAIKMCPLVLELKSRPADFETVVCVTGQHRQMLDQVLDTFNIVPDHDLSIMKDKQTLFDITTNILERIRAVLESERPDVVLVHGDTSTTFVTALACFYLQIPVGHVEAGLRTYNIRSPYPEEFNRQAVSIVAQYNFAPTTAARDNLLREGKNPGSIWVTGNTAIDALKTTVRDDYSHPLLDWAAGSRLILLTAHRRENLGEPMRHMFRAIKRIVDEHADVKVLYPIHLNPAVRETAAEIFGDMERVRLVEPMEVLDFHNFIARSYLVLTDSGGIQEEAPSLGKPVLVMRDTTERPEGITAGTLRLVGTDEEPIYDAFKELLEDEAAYGRMSRASNPYGDGHASERIADVLEGREMRAVGNAVLTKDNIPKICIFGSCVTRDVFDFADKNEWVKQYYARQSIISAVAEPVPLEESEIELESPFQRRAVMRDFHKTFFEDIHGNDYDFIIIDLIDERFLVARAGDSMITCSGEYVNGKLEEKRGYPRVPYKEKYELWKPACQKFVQGLEPYLSQGRVFVHSAYMATRYEENNSSKMFFGKQFLLAQDYNKFLTYAYEVLQECAEGKLIVLPAIPAIGDPNHKWGLSITHYQRQYYQTVYELLLDAFKKTGSTE